MENEVNVAMRPTLELLAPFVWISELEGAQDTDRPAIANRFLTYIDELSTEEDSNGKSELSEQLNLAKKNKASNEILDKVGDIPSSLKIRTDLELKESVRLKFQNALGLKVVQMPYMYRISAIAYALHLIEENKKISEVNIEKRNKEDYPIILQFADLTMDRKLIAIYEKLVGLEEKLL